jgi:hypothetical protein
MSFKAFFSVKKEGNIENLCTNNLCCAVELNDVSLQYELGATILNNEQTKSGSILCWRE